VAIGGGSGILFATRGSASSSVLSYRGVRGRSPGSPTEEGLLRADAEAGARPRLAVAAGDRVLRSLVIGERSSGGRSRRREAKRGRGRLARPRHGPSTSRTGNRRGEPSRRFYGTPPLRLDHYDTLEPVGCIRVPTLLISRAIATR